jgi:DNA helicase HerA-like ATPase
MITPLAYADSLRIGSVDSVSPDEIKVLLDIEAPGDVALNTGVPRPFPRISSYVLLPSDSGFLVAQIEWITIERSQYPKRKGMQDFGVIDLPFPLRKMSLMPLGILKEQKNGKESTYSFSRGVDIFPTVGDPVLLPAQDQLKSIVESGEKRRVKIGTSPLASNADVSVDPDRLFGRHLAILGNTGSGKSCSVAGVIRWSIDAARTAKEKANKQIEGLYGEITDEIRENLGLNSFINSRFIILDPNGEYSKAFIDMENVRLFAVEGNEERNIRQLQVPLWFWNSAEWCAFTQASSKAQRPTLIQSLRSVRDGQIGANTTTPSHSMRRFLRTAVTILSIERTQGNPWGNFPKNKSFFEKLQKWQGALSANTAFNQQENDSLAQLKAKVDQLVQARSVQYANMDFVPAEVDELITLASSAHSTFGGSDQDVLPIDADTPRRFTGEELLRSIEANGELMGTSDYIETMLMRVRTLLSDSRMRTITSCDEDLTLEKWLDDYICPSDTSNGAITVIDLSLVPAEVVHIVTAVIARMTLEALQRYRRLNDGKTLPTTLVMEEAHTFIRRYASDSEETPTYSMCTQVFEKIAREGRKFGLGLVLSSQRPSELSPTVLSQCNTFLLHRISNDRDQELVSKLVPDNLRGMLRELPTLPSQRAILLGWASELPVMVQMNYLSEEQRPQSNDPDYWDIWTAHGDNSRKADWGTIAHDWQEAGQIAQDDVATVGADLGGTVTAIDDDDLPF